RSVRAGHRARRVNPGDQEPGFRHAVRKCWRYGESDRRTERRRSRHLEDRTITVATPANMRTTIIIGAMLFALTLAMAVPASAKDLWDRVEHHDANSNGVKIHYVAIGKGPLIVMIHGFPDFWYTWRKQMDALSGQYRVVAVDQRGYDLSDRPAGVEQYAMPLLVADIGAVIKAEGRDKAVIVGHDWGGAVSWALAT